MAATLDTVLDEIREIQSAARTGGTTGRPQWPMIVLRTPKGWTGPKIVDGLPVEGTWRAHQVPIDEVRTNPDHLRPARDLDAQLPARGAVRRERHAPARARGAGPARHRRMGANPHANGGLLLRDLMLPDFRDYAVDVPKPGRPTSEATRVLGTFLRDVMARQPGQLPDVRARRDRLEPPPGHLRGDRPAWEAEISPTTTTCSRRPGDGGPLGAPVPGLAGGLPADRPARPVQLLRGLHPHHRLDVQPARQVVEGHPRDPLAPADRLAQLPALLAGLAPGPQRLLPPGPGLHRPRGQQEGRDHPRLPAARTPTACSRSPTTACAAATTST